MTRDTLGALFEQLIDRIVDRIADRVAQRLQSAGSDYVDQSNSPLGPRRHIALIRSGKLPGTQIGRLYVARSTDVDAFVRNSHTDCVANEPLDEVDQLGAELGLQKRSKEGG